MNDQKAARDWRSYLTGILLVLVASSFWIVRYPTEFGLSDHEVLLPHIQRLLDPTYLPNDPFLNSGSQHVVFVHLTASMARWVGVESAMYAVRVVSVVAGMMAMMFGCRVIGGASRGVFVFLMLLLGERALASASGYHFLPPFGTPVGLSWPCCFVGVLLVMLGRMSWASVAMLVGALFHPIVAAHTLLAICVMHIVAGEQGGVVRRIRALLPVVVAYLIGATPLIWYGMTHPSEGMGGREFVEIFCLTRHPHHTVISTWSFNRVARLILTLGLGLSAVGWLMFGLTDMQRRRGRQLLLVLSTLSVIAIGGFVGIEWIRVKLAAVSYPYRSLVYFNIIGTIGAATVLTDIVTSQESFVRESVVRTILGIVTLVTAALLWCVLPGWQSVVWQFAAMLCVVLVLGCVASKGRGGRGASMAGVVAAVIGLLMFGGPLSVTERMTTTRWNELEASMAEAFARVDDVVGPDDMVLVTPTIRGFRAHAHRIPYFDWKCFPFDAEAARGWYERYRELYGQETRLSELSRFCRERNVRWILIDMEKHTPEGTPTTRMQRDLSALRARSTWFNGRFALLEFDLPRQVSDLGTANASARIGH